MTEHKFTDEEIKKALECACSADNICNECPVISVHFLAEKALDLINRYEAEIANLEIELKAMRGAANSYKAEVERLTVNMNAFGLGMKREKERADTARAEAIKEFAERLKEKPIKYGIPLLGLSTKTEIEEYFNDIMMQVRDAIDTVKKEMTGEAKTDTDFPKDYSYGY